MRICRIGKGIYVHGVPLDTSWFCPYCSVPTVALLLTRLSSLLRDTGSRIRTSARLARPLGYSRSPVSFGDVSACNHKETQTGYKHLIKNNAVYLVLNFFWFHNTAVERQPAGEADWEGGRVAACRLAGTYFENCPCDMVCSCLTSGHTIPADVERWLAVLILTVPYGR
jgi:hypothetical protein